MVQQQEMHTLADPLEAIEHCYRMGWSDGLPVVPPTPERVRQFLEHVGLAPSDVVLVEPMAGRVVTAEKAAANAVMAGCLPEHFPVVLAALEAMGAPEFNLHGATLTSGGTAVMAVVGGPTVKKIGLNSGVALFCPGGHRANATIGRALHLVLWNCTGNRPDEMDRSIMGHPGRYSMCIAEREEVLPPGWEPFYIDRGVPREASSVTVLTVFSPMQTGYAGSSDPRDILINVADTLKVLQPWHRELWMVMSPEIARHLGRAGWRKADVREFLFQEARRTYSEYKRVFKLGYPTPEDRARAEACRDDDMLPVLNRPEALHLVVGGGDGDPFVMIIPLYAAGTKATPVTRIVKEGRSAFLPR